MCPGQWPNKCQLLFPQIVTKDAFPCGNHSPFLIFISISTTCSCLPGGTACHPSPTKIKCLAEGRLHLASLFPFYSFKAGKLEKMKHPGGWFLPESAWGSSVCSWFGLQLLQKLSLGLALPGSSLGLPGDPGTAHLIWLRMPLPGWGPTAVPLKPLDTFSWFQQLWISPMDIQALVFSGLAFSPCS